MLAIEQAQFLIRELDRERHADPRRLTRYGAKAYSQSDEDGMIAEIFRRIGALTSTFVEIGVGGGDECNTLWLLVQGWSGSWIEERDDCRKAIHSKHRERIKAGDLRVIRQKASAANADALVYEAAGGGDLDLLCIDIDYNDYWVWRAIERTRARVVVIEYNASWPPPARLTVPYQPDRRWRGTNHFGASIGALASLGTRKGYELVGCSLSGVNAFFVRADLVEDKFLSPGSAEEHYEPPRYFLSPLQWGHPSDPGPVVRVD